MKSENIYLDEKVTPDIVLLIYKLTLFIIIHILYFNLSTLTLTTIIVTCINFTFITTVLLIYSLQSANGKNIYNFDVFLFSTNSPTFNVGLNIWLLGWLNTTNKNDISLFLIIDHVIPTSYSHYYRC